MRYLIPLCLLAFPAQAETIAGPIPAEIVRVIDGDTIDVEARIWLGQYILSRVRIDGVDTPELKGKCQAEIDLAVKAKEYIEALGPSVILHNIHYGKYAGRVVASVSVDGADVSTGLILAGLGRAYNGGKRKSWC